MKIKSLVIKADGTVDVEGLEIDSNFHEQEIAIFNQTAGFMQAKNKSRKTNKNVFESQLIESDEAIQTEDIVKI